MIFVAIFVAILIDKRLLLRELSTKIEMRIGTRIVVAFHKDRPVVGFPIEFGTAPGPKAARRPSVPLEFVDKSHVSTGDRGGILPGSRCL